MGARSSQKHNKRLKKAVKNKALAIPPWTSSGVLIGLGIILITTFLVYLPTLHNGFVWDDFVYIQKNPLIYTIDIPKKFSTWHAGNYHPLTILVHSIEYRFFKLNEMGYHVINMLLHVMNTAMVFYVMRRFTGNVFVTLATALFFGIHPLHVESVAWVSELKDMLYAFFFLMGIWSYLRFLDIRNRKWYFLTISFFLLSVLSKGMAVSFPLVLLLIDYMKGRLSDRKAWLEKISFFFLSLAFGIIAIFAQQSESALHEDVIPIMQRIVFGCYGFIQYLIKLVIPVSLSAYYPYPISPTESIPASYFIYPLLALGVVGWTFFSVRYNKKWIFGIGFFTATIILVLKFLPVGYAVMADRYSYIPSIGIVYLFGEGLFWLYHHQTFKPGKVMAIGLLMVMSIFFARATYQRSQVWKNNQTLWTDVIEKGHRVSLAYLNRGIYFLDNKQYAEAAKDLDESIRLNAEDANAYYNRGLLYINTDRKSEALEDYDKAISLDPDMEKAYINRGNLLMSLNRLPEALSDLNKGLELDPSIPEGFNNRGLLHENDNRLDEALRDYSQAIRLNPNYVNAYVNRGNTFVKLLQIESAIEDYSRAITLNPKTALAFYNLGLCEIKLNNREKACQDFQSAYGLGFSAANDALNIYCR